jgi:hypothetical protein
LLILRPKITVIFLGCPIVRLASSPKVVQRRTATKDQVVAEFDLLEEQPMLAARFFALFRSEEGGEPR